MLWSHFNDLFAPATSKPAPSDAAESAEPLATVINLSAILNSEVWISVAEPNTVKLPVTWTSPVKSPSANVTLLVVARFWLIVSRFALFAWVWVVASKESILVSTEVEKAPSMVSNLLSTDVENGPSNTSNLESSDVENPPSILSNLKSTDELYEV